MRILRCAEFTRIDDEFFLDVLRNGIQNLQRVIREVVPQRWKNYKENIVNLIAQKKGRPHMEFRYGSYRDKLEGLFHKRWKATCENMVAQAT